MNWQVYSKQGTHLKTYVYSLSIPTAASFISLVVGPLVVLPDRHNPTVSYFGLPGYISELQCSVSFFHSVFRCFFEPEFLAMLCSKVLSLEKGLDYHACCTHVQNSLLDFFLIVKSKLICTPLDGHELSVFCPCVAVCMRSI
jgi:hypothetical protein